ncbi:MAG: polysaccharide deacetylase family protein [Firmicutes bacterium]|nr:polysaccharide deacetylase family protein [Bacillota bacterium]
MRLIILERKKVVLFTCWLMLVLVGIGLATHWPQAKRQWFGVKDGVTLEGHSMARLLPEEVRKVVTELAKFYSIEPRNAGYFAETGEIIPEKDGLGVDIEATITSVLSAAPGESLSLVTYALPATVSKDYFSPVFQGPTTHQRVSLTINVAWGEEELPAMLAILKKHGVKATFFFDGAWVKKFPEMVRRIAAEGHEIANHGLYHGHPLRMNREELRRLVLENDRLLAEVIGGEPAKLFAPPYGEFNEQIVAVAADLGFRTIMWTIDTIDWQRPAPEVIIRRVVEKLKPGAIILMHPTVPTVSALEPILTHLREKDYTAVTVSTLLRGE